VLFAAVDSMLLLDRDGDAFKLAFELRHGREPEPMRLTRTERLWFVPARPPEDLLPVAETVRLLALKYGRLIEALVSDLKVSERTAARMVDRAKKAGLIVKTDDGRYEAANHCQPHPNSAPSGREGKRNA